ncbi:hypothetical protein VNI00_014535 [Paramarasmius palmivorus]|uniref:Helicase ATP-binding domain-containing protein n=1 Tax=Paramarasmius palmivorus TaxID=297713 RepID=A0AAW0BS15_9AGAR
MASTQTLDAGALAQLAKEKNLTLEQLLQAIQMLPEIINPAQVVNDELALLKHEYPRMAQLVNGDTQLAQWMPPQDSPYFEHIRNLGIPEHRLYDGPGGSLPNLLLHDLGCLPGYSAAVSTTLTSLFETGCNWLLLNTSGSGKTRLLLEGLCLHWGLYFTCANDPSIASNDLFNAMHRGFPQEGLITPLDLNNEPMIARNRDIAARKLSEVLLSRLIILHYFLSLAEDVIEVHKKRWLCLQVQPNLAGHGPTRQVDIFDACRYRLSQRKMSYEQLEEAIHQLLVHISFKIGQKMTFVIDEAQSAVDLHRLAFRSQLESVHRPALRELVVVWATLMPDSLAQDSYVQAVAAQYIISGTGVDKRLIMEALSSTVCKPKNLFPWYFTGCFDTERAQLGYVHRFLPHSLRCSDEGTALMKRMFFWLRGRPHTLLNEYVEAIGGFQPTDARAFIEAERLIQDESVPQSHSTDSAQDDVPNQTTLVEFQPLDFEKVQKHGSIMEKLRDCCHAYLLHGIYPESFRNKELLYVQYGIARFQTRDRKRVATITEPLVLFACSTWLNQLEPLPERNYTIHEHLVSSITNHDNKTGRNYFEDCVSNYLTIAFSDPTPLSTVFRAAPGYCNPTLLMRHGQLVALHTQGPKGTLDYSTYQLEPGHKHPRIAGCLGNSSMRQGTGDKSHGDLVDWLSLRSGTAFCFPMNAMGPDLIFVFRLTDPTDPTYASFIWVAVQCKNRNTVNALSPGTLIESATTITPSQFFMPRKGSTSPGPSPAQLSKQQSVLQAMDSAFPIHPKDQNLVGQHNVLRVICSFPAKTKFGDLKDGPKAELLAIDNGENHPLVYIDEDAFRRRMDKYPPENSLSHMEPKIRKKLEQLAKKTPVQLEEYLRTSVDLSDIYDRLSLYDVAELKDQLKHFRTLPGAINFIPKSTSRYNKEELYDQLLGACKAFHCHVLDTESNPLLSDEIMDVDGAPELDEDGQVVMDVDEDSDDYSIKLGAGKNKRELKTWNGRSGKRVRQ